MKSKTSIDKQFQFLVLLTMYDYPEYQEGLMVRNLEARLAENRKRWFEVGVVGNNKQFDTRFAGTLSVLDIKLEYLRKASVGKYVKTQRFEEGLQSLVSDLAEYLELDIEYGDYILGETDREVIVQELEKGTIAYSILSYDHDKKMNLLTDEQALRLAQLSVQYGCI